MTRICRGRRGQALAEFALVLPVLLLFIAGIIEFGRAYNLQQVVTDAAREGARLAAVDDDNYEDQGVVESKIRERLATAVADPDAANIAWDGPWKAQGLPITVTVSVQYRMPLIGALMDWVGGPHTITIASTATMRNE